MPLLVPSRTAFGEFQAIEGSHLTTQPATAFGTTVTPGNNAFGTAVQVGADLTLDAYGIYINVNSVAVSGAARDALLQIGFDWSGGTTFPASPDSFNSITLLVSCASGMVAGGVNYYFPLFIPAGTAILARGSVNNATVGTMRVFWQTSCRPARPEAIRVGRYVESLGAVTASSRGTTITPGTTSEGSWTSIGTLGSDRPCWFWEWGVGINTGTMANQMHATDLAADSSGDRIILRDGTSGATTAEAITKIQAFGSTGLNVAMVEGGTTIYARSQVTGSAPTGWNVMAYGVGG